MTQLKNYIYPVFFILLTSIAFSAYPQSFSASAKLDTNAMLIGDQVKLDLQFSFPQNTIVHWPQIGDTILRSLQVIDRSRMDTSYSKDKKFVTINFSLFLTI